MRLAAVTHLAMPEPVERTYEGIPVVIEWRKGETRTGTNKRGEKWERLMVGDYGFIPGTSEGEGDGEDLDVYIGPNPEPRFAYLIEQLDDDGKFDEYKLVFGVDSHREAVELYLAHYPEGWESHIGSVRETEFARLRELILSHVEEPQ